MANGIGTDDPHGFNKGRSLKLCVGSRVRQTPEDCRRTYRLKRCGNNNKGEDNSSKTLNDKKRKKKQNLFVVVNSYLVASLSFNNSFCDRQHEYIQVL